MASFELPVSKNIWDFDPTTIGGCCLWLDGADANTLFSDTGGTTAATVGGSVAFWKDKSVLANNATQTTAINRPTRTSGGGLYFVQANTHFLQLANAGAGFLPTGASNGTYFTVSQVNAGQTLGGNVFIHGTGADSQARALQESGNSYFNFSSVITTEGVSRNGPGMSNIGQGIPPTSNHVTTVLINNIVGSAWVNGRAMSNTNADLQNTPTTMNIGTTAAYIGRGIFLGGATRDYWGNISEILVFNVALSNADRQTIEGYLAWKWGLQANLPASHPYSSNTSSLSSILPNNYSGLALWLDAADANTVSLSGSNVTVWNDKSGNGNNATTSGSPSYVSSSLNGLNGVQLSGTSQSWGTPSFVLSPTSRLSVFVVARGGTLDASQNINLLISGTSFQNLSVYLQYSAANGPYALYVGGAGAFANTSFTNTRNVPNIYELVYDSSTASPYVNGTPYSTFSAPISGSSLTTAQSLRASNNGANTFIQYEVLFFNVALTTTQRQQIEGYLARKWGLQASLPTGHPYSLTVASPLDSISPSNYSGLSLWLDAADTSTITNQGTSAMTWADKSPQRRTSATVTGSGGFFPTNSPITVNGVNLNTVLMPTSTTGTSLVYTFQPWGSVAAGRPGQGTSFWVSSAISGTGTPGFNNNQSFGIYSGGFSNSASGVGATVGTGYVSTGTYAASTTSSSNTLVVTRTGSALAPQFTIGGLLKSTFSTLVTGTGAPQPASFTNGSNIMTTDTINTCVVPGMRITAAYISGGFATVNSIAGTDNRTITLSANATSNQTSVTNYVLSSSVASTIPSGTYVTAVTGSYTAPTGTYTFTLSQPISILSANTPLIIVGNDVQTNNDMSTRLNATFNPFTSGSFLTTLAVTGSGGSASLSVNGGTPVSTVTPISVTASGIVPIFTFSNPATSSMNIFEMIYFNAFLSTTQRQEIEGYLARKWGLQSSLPVGHPYATTVARLETISPSKYDNLALWMDAADSNSVSSTSGNVTSVNDKSGNGRTMTKTGAGNIPYASSSLNGLNMMTFSTANTYLATSSTNFDFGTNDFAFFAVVITASTSNGLYPIISKNYGNTANAWMFWRNNGSQLGIENYNNSSSVFGINSAASSALASTAYIGSAVSLRNTTTTVFVNGVGGTAGGASTASNTSGSVPILIGATSALSFSGQIGEILVYTGTITTTQRQEIEGYLAGKWGLRRSLPSTHPYYESSQITYNPSLKPFSRNFAPTDISDCVMWFDGADLTSMFTDTAGTTAVTGNGSIVRYWRDKSGSGNNITTAGTGPTLTTSSNPCGFDMNHATGHLSKTDVVNNSRTYTKFLVFRRTNDPANPTNQFQRLFSYAKTFGDQRLNDPSGFHIQAVGSQTSYQVLKMTNNAGFTILTNTYYVVTIVANPLTMSLFLNGSLTANATVTLPNTDFSGTTFRLGNSFTQGQLWPGFINETISYNRQLSVTEYREVEGYLAWKWGIRTSLPTTHPFYRFPTPSTTPIQPELQLYKSTFDPADLSPDIWFDPQDKSTIAVDSNNRVMQWLNKGTSATCSSFLFPGYSSRTLNTTETLSNAIGLSGPLITTSTTGDGIGMDYLDFSGGGSFYISSVNISGTTAVITLGTAEVGTVTGGSISAFSISTGSNSINTTTLATIYFSPFALQNMIHPFAIGSTIRVAGTVSTGTTLNGDWVVSGCTPFYVQFALVGATAGTITTQGTITSVTTPNIATVTYTTSSRTQRLLAGHTLATISGMTPAGLNGTTPTIWNASPNSIQFLTSVATGTISAAGTITGPTVPHNIPAGAQVSIGLASGYRFSNNSDDSLYPIFNIESINLTTIVTGRGTPYIVASATTNTITVNIPNTTSYPSGFPAGNMQFSAGRVDYGSITIAGFNSQNVANTLTSTGNSSTSATINFTNFSRLRNNTFVAGDTIFINGVTNPTTYNGFWYVTGGTNTGLSGSVTIDTTAVGTLANMVSIAGTISRVSYSMPSGCLGIRSISVAGTTATVTYNNSTRQLNLNPNGVPFKVGHYIYIAGTTASGATPGIFNGTWIVTGQSSDSGGVSVGTTGTLTFTTAAAAGTTAGTGILTRGAGGVGLAGAFPTTSGTITTTSATVTFANQPIVPFIAGQQIYIAGTTSSSTDINGTWTVLSSTNSSVTFTITGTPGTLTVQGTLSAAVLVVTSGTYASPNLTLNFSPTLAVAPFAANAMVSLFGVTPSANIGNWRVVSSTTSSVILNVPTGAGPIAAPFTGTVALALPLTRGTAIPHGLLSGYNIEEGGGSTIDAFNTNGENSNGLSNVIYTINAVPSVCTYQIFPLYFNLTSSFSAACIQATVGPSMRTDLNFPQLFYPISAYCLENTRSQTSGGIFNGSNASMMIVPHAYTGSIRSFSPPVLSTSSSVNAGLNAKGTISLACFFFNNAPRVFAVRQNGVRMNNNIDQYYQNTTTMPGDDSSFRMFTRSLNLTSSTVNDVGPQTDIVGMVGGRYETQFLALNPNGYSQISTVSAYVTNAVWSANVATLTIVSAGVVPIQPLDTIVVAGIVNLGATPSVFNGSFVVTGTPTLTSVTYALNTNPGGTYVSGTGTVIPSTSTPLTTGHIRLGAQTSAVPSFTPVSNNFLNWLEIGISEIIAFNRVLTTEERQLLEGYMAQKYGFQNNLGARSTTTVVQQPYTIRNLFVAGTAPPYTVSITMPITSNYMTTGTRMVIAGCTEAPMMNGSWTVGASGNIATFNYQTAVSNPVFVGLPNRLVGGTGTVTLTGNSTTVPMSAAQNVTSGTVVNGAVYTVTIPAQTVTVVSTTSLTLATAPIFSAGTSASGITISVNSVLVYNCTFTSGSTAVTCNATTATSGLCPSTTNIMVLPTTTTTTTGNGVSSYVLASAPTATSPILPSNTGGVPVLAGVPNPIVGGTGTVTLTGNTSSITGIASQSITLGTVVTGGVYTVSLPAFVTASSITTTSLVLSSAPVFSAGTTLSGVSLFIGSTLITNCVLTSGSTTVTYPSTTITGTQVVWMTFTLVLPTTTTTTATGTVTSVNIATPTCYLSPIAVSSSNTVTALTSTDTSRFIHPYRTTVPTIGSTLSLSNRYTQGLAAWFDAANSGTIGFSSGNFVNSWASAGGNISGLTLIQATVANQPTLVANALNGLPGLRFVTGTISGSNYPSSSNLTSSLQTYILNQVATASSNIEYTYFTVLNFITNPTQNASVVITASSNNYLIVKNNNIIHSASSIASTNYSPLLTVNRPYIIVSTRRGNVLTNIVTGNGARNIASTSSKNITTSITTGYRVGIGGFSSTPASNNDPYGGDIYEHIMFRYAMTDQAIYQIEGYLAWKWGLQTALPTTHPYYRLRP